MLDSMGAGTFSVVGAIMGFFMMLVLGAIFSSLGGLLGAFFFKKKVGRCLRRRRSRLVPAERFTSEQSVDRRQIRSKKPEAQTVEARRRLSS